MLSEPANSEVKSGTDQQKVMFIASLHLQLLMELSNPKIPSGQYQTPRDLESEFLLELQFLLAGNCAGGVLCVGVTAQRNSSIK